MSNCSNCSAPLPPGSNICDYCGSVNDTDLKGIHRYTVHEPETERACPRCKISLTTIDLKIDGKFLIERCEECLGLFFDTGELEALLKASIDHVYQVDRKRMNQLIEINPSCNYTATYIPCPVCGTLMSRVNFGKSSGVIIDRCPEHGNWLDGGELRHLMEWVKAGGEILAQQRNAEMEKEKEREKKRRTAHPSMGAGAPPLTFDQYTGTLRHDAPDLFTVISRVVRWIVS